MVQYGHRAQLRYGSLALSEAGNHFSSGTCCLQAEQRVSRLLSRFIHTSPASATCLLLPIKFLFLLQTYSCFLSCLLQPLKWLRLSLIYLFFYKFYLYYSQLISIFFPQYIFQIHMLQCLVILPPALTGLTFRLMSRTRSFMRSC